MYLKINPEFRDLIPRLSADEYKGLEESIIADGCRDALIAQNGTVIDGHNRYKICTENNIEFEVAEIDFADDSEAKIWIIKNQFATKNLYEYIKDLRTAGVISEDKEKGIIEIAAPMGVVIGIVPTTNPTSTLLYKALISLKV